MRRRSALLIVAAALLSGHSSSLAAADAAAREAWFVIEFSGTPVGIGRDRWVPSDDGVFYESYVEIRARRMGAPIEFLTSIEEWDDSTHVLTRFQSETSINGEWIRSQGERRDGKIYLTTTGAAYSTTDSIEWVEGTVGMAWADEEIRASLAAGAGDFGIQLFDPRLGGIQRNRFVVSDEKQQDGLLIVDQFDEGVEVPSTRLYMDDRFEIQRIESKQLNMTLTMRRIDAADVAGITLDPNFDMIRDQMIACEGYPGDPEDLDEVEFELTFSRPFSDVSGFHGPNQRVVAREGNTMRILVTRQTLAPAAGGESQPEGFLRAGRYVQSDDPRIRALADSIASATGASGPQLAQAMARWVGDYISNKSYGRGFSSAVDVLDSRAGDCSEHSVLLTALLRAAGIPARVVVGLAYDSGTLVGHMWTEAFTGQWVTVDALDPDNSPKRIRIASSPDERAIDETNIVNAYSLVAGLHVTVTAYKPRARGPGLSR
jgi:hypothetical protein